MSTTKRVIVERTQAGAKITLPALDGDSGAVIELQGAKAADVLIRAAAAGVLKS
jgi:hypothetical protein